MTSPRITATRSARVALGAALAIGLAGGSAYAQAPAAGSAPQGAGAAPQGAGYVSNLSGPLFAVKGDGSRRVLSTQSTVQPGDTLITEDKTYARVRFTDTSEVTLRPNTQLQIENYAFDRQAPEADNSAFRLFKGALRTVTGLIGKRGSQTAYRMNTATATIGIRGTVYGLTVCAPGSCGSLPPGTYVNVIDGQVGIAPPGGAPLPGPPVLLSAGQFGFVPVSGPPVQLPGDPGVGRLFAPPPAFVSRADAGPPGTPPGPKPSGGGCDVH